MCLLKLGIPQKIQMNQMNLLPQFVQRIPMIHFAQKNQNCQKNP
jgi:hypothetical protein